jgi:hypothetical protein
MKAFEDAAWWLGVVGLFGAILLPRFLMAAFGEEAFAAAGISSLKLANAMLFASSWSFFGLYLDRQEAWKSKARTFAPWMAVLVSASFMLNAAFYFIIIAGNGR